MEAAAIHLLERTVTTDSGCMEFQGCIQSNGYARATIKRRTDYAHRHIYRLVNGPIDDGLHVCHTCDNRRCINPSHLFLGTRLDNMQDARSKGRIANGNRLPHTKLSKESISKIALLYAMGEKRMDIARDFGISIPYVSEVSNNLGVRRHVIRK